MTAPATLTRSVEDYLKAIFDLGEGGQPVTTSRLARHLGVSPASVTGMLQRLASARPALIVMPKDVQSASTNDLLPSGLQNLIEFVIEALHGLTKGIAGHWTPKFFPIIATIFLLVITANWIGLLPGVGTIGFFEHPEDGHGYVANGVVPSAVPLKDLYTNQFVAAK